MYCFSARRSHVFTLRLQTFVSLRGALPFFTPLLGMLPPVPRLGEDPPPPVDLFPSEVLDLALAKIHLSQVKPMIVKGREVMAHLLGQLATKSEVRGSNPNSLPCVRPALKMVARSLRTRRKHDQSFLPSLTSGPGAVADWSESNRPLIFAILTGALLIAIGLVVGLGIGMRDDDDDNNGNNQQASKNGFTHMDRTTSLPLVHTITLP
ncbi:hypothetical protein PoB_006315700 [Plakobranchus ocellatus]|uniref:Uncharacterized protein n=1 Tax=Plakobranchus ocellatus TaxID=259542 RepID=A0AAV4CXJ8_9GAST|nr:hypothetical protein PoB_006315700 [Plakobranchus ocellatus]